MSQQAYAGIDLGTSAVKVVLVDRDGRQLGRADAGYELSRPEPGAAEADPYDWWHAASDALAAARADCPHATVIGVGLSGQMHGLVLTREDGVPVRPALTWADTRAGEQVGRWQALTAEQRARLGNPLVPGMTGPMLARLAAVEPGAVRMARWALTAKDWLRLQLTGEPASDPSDASATLLWDLPADAWADDVLAALDLPGDLLPDVRPSGLAAGRLTAGAASALDLPTDIPIACGAADAAAGLLATRPGCGRLQLTLGTGAQLVHEGAGPATPGAPVTHTYRTADPTGWYAMAAVQNFGLALDWARRALGADWPELYAALDGRSDPRRLPVFVPYLTGERTPVVGDRVRACWQGIDQAHTREDLLRSAVVGAVCAVRDAADALPEAPDGTVWLVGGGSRHPALRRLLADVLGRPVAPVRTEDASAWGAVVLAARAAGAELPVSPTAVVETVTPQPGHRWTEVLATYRSAARSLVQQADPR